MAVLDTEPCVSNATDVLRFGQRVPALCQGNRQIRRQALPLAYGMRLCTIAESVDGNIGLQTQQTHQLFTRMAGSER